MSTLQVGNLHENEFCTYITFYRGNKLPPFYIGYTKLNNINKGYRGSVSSKKYKDVWKKEQKENPELFVTKIISVHRNKDDAKLKEETIQRKLNVIKNPLYVNRAIGHHYDNTGNKHSEETKKHYSRIRKGRPGLNKGKKKTGYWWSQKRSCSVEQRSYRSYKTYRKTQRKNFQFYKKIC